MPLPSENLLDKIASAVPGLDLWQPRDWPHRRGDEINLELHSFPLTDSSPGRRSVACEHCSNPCLCIHDNVLCWRCKGAFCLHCFVPDPSAFAMTPMTQILENGFGRCKNCCEPLRSIALVDVFRIAIEAGGPFIDRNNPIAYQTSTTNFFTIKGSSLVQEAEDALKRGQDCMNQNPEQAILDFTHAINAINYLASASLEERLILRAHDILLISHSQRAKLEDNQLLADSILSAYPKQSVKTSSRSLTNESWYLSRSAYESLYYPLPTILIAGAARGSGSFVRIDMRSQSKAAAFSSPNLRTQIALAGLDPALVSVGQEAHPHCDGYDCHFDSLKGSWKGVWSYHPVTPCAPMSGEPHFSRIFGLIQFVRVFPTNLAASEYTRILFENKSIGEEGPPLNARDNPMMAKALKRKAKEFGVTSLQKVRVLKGFIPAMNWPAFSCVAAVENVSTKLYVTLVGGDHAEETACYIAAKAFAYLDRQLQQYRSSNQFSIQECRIHPVDHTVCAYCGKDDGPLKSCSRCKLAKYCGVECQKKHWSTKGEFGHSMFCKAASRSS